MLDSNRVARFQFAGQDIPWLLRHWATHKPDHPLLIWEPKDGQDKRWTYKEFDDQTSQLAAGLAAKGVQLGDKVLIHCDNSPEIVLAWYACTKLGAVGVTTNTRSVGAEIEYFAGHTQCVGAITQPQYAKLVQESAKGLGWIVVTEDNSGVAASAEEAAHGLPAFSTLYGDAADAPTRNAEPMLPAGILFTSGTTSRPKAVVHTHANALWAGRQGSANLEMGTDDTYLIYLPFFHVNAQSWSMWTTLGVGGTVVLQPKFSASRFWEVIAKHSVTHISLIPFVFKAVAGEPVPDHTVKVGAFGLVMPELDAWLKMRVAPFWGMTETVIHSTRTDTKQHFPNGTMGKPTPGYEFAIVNPDTGELCDDGSIGELLVRGTRGVQLFLEYYDNEEAMQKAFTEDGWFRTGDMVRLGEEGCFYYCDRDKDALKVGGENVSAKEVEDICRSVPGVSDVAIVGRSHEMLDMVPVAFVIKTLDAPTDEELSTAILAVCKENLADFKVPRAAWCVEEFPRALLDKVAKNKLREMAEQREI
jgi:crotonobetaine/carnitine-CoA ligase